MPPIFRTNSNSEKGNACGVVGVAVSSFGVRFWAGLRKIRSARFTNRGGRFNVPRFPSIPEIWPMSIFNAATILLHPQHFQSIPLHPCQARSREIFPTLSIRPDLLPHLTWRPCPTWRAVSPMDPLATRHSSAPLASGCRSSRSDSHRHNPAQYGTPDEAINLTLDTGSLD